MANINIESQFITAIIENKLSLDSVVKSDFEPRFLQYYSNLYEWICSYYDQNQKLPGLELTQTRFPEFQRVEVTENVEQIVIALRNYNKADRFQSDIQQALTLYQKTGQIDKAINLLQNRLDSYGDDTRQDIFDLTDENFLLGQELYKKRREAYLEKSRYGIPTGFGTEIDSFFNGGWQKGLYYGLVGKSNIGKTWCLLRSAKEALSYGLKVLFFSLEGQIDRDYNRLLTLATELDNAATLSGITDEKIFLTAQKQLLELSQASGGKFYLALYGDREYYTPSLVYQKIRKIKPDIVFLDYLTLLTNGKGNDDWQDYTNISKRLKNMSTSQDIPIVVAVQGRLDNFNKAKDGDLNEEDIALSKGIIRDLDGAIGISRPTGTNNILKFNSMKGRDAISEFRGFFRTDWNSGKIVFSGFDENRDF